VTRFDHFLECPPQAMKFASRYVYSTRNVDAPYAEFLSFTFYSFRSNAVRDAMLAKVMSDDSEAIANPDFDIFYFVPAGRTDAVRVVRRRAVPID